MNRRLLVLSLLAAFLVGWALLARMGDGEQIDAPPALTAAELAALPATLEGDMRMMEEVRRRCGGDPDRWRKLPEAARTVYATLWAEEVHRTVTWAQRAGTDRVEPGDPTFEEVAAAYGQLDCPETAQAVLALGKPFDETAAAFLAWAQERSGGRTTPPPATRPLDAAARAAFSRLDRVRPQRLAFVRANAETLGIR